MKVKSVNEVLLKYMYKKSDTQLRDNVLPDKVFK